jgi:hypothetical protein
MTIRKEVIGDATLYCGSMEDVLPTLGKVDTVVTQTRRMALRQPGPPLIGILPLTGIRGEARSLVGTRRCTRKQIESDQSVATRDH